jgi:DNA-directed RNA polymerase specialized sigma24 family protein
LSVLDADGERAAHEYERLRGRTIGLLRWWGAADAEDLADLALDRVARKLDEGAMIADGSLGAYVRGVARMIFYESRRRPQVQRHDLPLISPPALDEEAVYACLDSCLAALEPAERDLMLRYYGPGKPAEVRRDLASHVGVTLTALRIRAHRLRLKLEQCVRACGGAAETKWAVLSSGSEAVE